MPGKNPPRKTSIRGQRHLLAYITPDEAALLKARGGTGELHKGIPSYPDYGGATGSSKDSERGGGRTTGGGDRGGMQADRGGARDKKFDSGYNVTRDYAQKKLDAQIALGAKNLKNMTNVQKIAAAVFPGAGFEPLQNYAAQSMGRRMKNVLSQPGSRAVVDPRTGRVTGIYNASGQLTGRDPERDRARAAAADRGRDTPIILLPFGATDEEEQAKLGGKEVIRSDLAKETEAERLKRLKAGKTQLSNRSLLSNVSRLGV